MQATINASTSVTDNTIQTCLNQTAQDASFTCEPPTTACPPGISSNCDFSGITIDQETLINTSCVQNATNNTSISQSVTQNVQQTSMAISASLGLSDTDAENVATTTQNISAAIVDNFNNTLSTGGDSNIGFYGGGCNNEFTLINASQMANWAQNGVQDTSAVNNLSQQLSQTITQVYHSNLF